MSPRHTPCCIVCSSKEAIVKYEARGKVGRLFPGKLGLSKNLTLMKPLTQFPKDHPIVTLSNGAKLSRAGETLEYHCDECGWSRPNPDAEVDGVTFMWFVSCTKCGERHISTELDKCASCDLGLL